MLKHTYSRNFMAYGSTLPRKPTFWVQMAGGLWRSGCRCNAVQAAAGNQKRSKHSVVKREQNYIPRRVPVIIVGSFLFRHTIWV